MMINTQIQAPSSILLPIFCIQTLPLLCMFRPESGLFNWKFVWGVDWYQYLPVALEFFGQASVVRALKRDKNIRVTIQSTLINQSLLSSIHV